MIWNFTALMCMRGGSLGYIPPLRKVNRCSANLRSASGATGARGAFCSLLYVGLRATMSPRQILALGALVVLAVVLICYWRGGPAAGPSPPSGRAYSLDTDLSGGKLKPGTGAQSMRRPDARGGQLRRVGRLGDRHPGRQDNHCRGPGRERAAQYGPALFSKNI